MNHPSIRSIAGAGAPTAVDAAHTALLVIDFQNEYFSGRLPIPDGPEALHNARRLIAFADAHGMQVFHVQHVLPAGAPLFAEGGDGVRLHAGIVPEARHALLQKSSVSVFASTDLDARLKAAGVTTLLVSGLMTHACVAGAARDAVPLGYEVIVAGDACATRDIDGCDGELVAHAALHRAALVSIADTFGAVLSTQRILQLA